MCDKSRPSASCFLMNGVSTQPGQIVLTVIFVILINEVFAKELDALEEGEEGKGGSFNKNELEKTIQKLKTIQMNM